MFYSRILAIVFSLFFSIQSTDSGLDGMLLNGVAQQETIDFTITNNGASLITVNYYIVIQDNILEYTQGETTLNPGDTVTVQALKSTVNGLSYTLKVTEKLASGEPGTFKTFTVVN